MPVKKRKPAKPSSNRGRGKGTGIAQYGDDIRRLRLEGITLLGIANWLRATHNLAVTRERVRQVLTKLLSADEHRAVLEAAKPATSCSVCGREGRTIKGLCGTHYERAKRGATDDEMAAPIKVSSHKPSKCLGCGRKIGPGTPRPRNRDRCPGCYSNWAYHNLPGRKRAVAEAQKRWIRRKYKADSEFRAKLRAYQKAYRLKQREALADKAAKQALAKKAARAARGAR